MLRRLLGRCLLSLSGLSLLLGVAVSGLWVRSYWLNDSAGAHWSQGTGYNGGQKEWFCLSERGKLLLVRNVHRYHMRDTRGEGFHVWTGAQYTLGSSAPGRRFDPKDTGALVPPSGGYFAGFGAGRLFLPKSSSKGFWDQSVVVLPHWAAALLLLLAATPFLARARRRWRRRRRLRDHLCLQCGYDLRASETLCPECGTAVTSACSS